MLITIGIASIVTFVVIFAVWIKDQINKNNEVSQQEFNRNKVEMIMNRAKK